MAFTDSYRETAKSHFLDYGANFNKLAWYLVKFHRILDLDIVPDYRIPEYVEKMLSKLKKKTSN